MTVCVCVCFFYCFYRPCCADCTNHVWTVLKFKLNSFKPLEQPDFHEIVASEAEAEEEEEEEEEEKAVAEEKEEENENDEADIINDIYDQD